MALPGQCARETPQLRASPAPVTLQPQMGLGATMVLVSWQGPWDSLTTSVLPCIPVTISIPGVTAILTSLPLHCCFSSGHLSARSGPLAPSLTNGLSLLQCVDGLPPQTLSAPLRWVGPLAASVFLLASPQISKLSR